MMLQYSENQIIQTFQALPAQLQTEVWNFMQFLVFKSKNEEFESENKKPETQQKKKRQFGYFPNGTFKMTDDFDAPLECFNDYMR